MIFKRYWAKHSKFLVYIYHYRELTMISGETHLIPEDYFQIHQDDKEINYNNKTIIMKHVESHKSTSKRKGTIFKLKNNEIIYEGQMYYKYWKNPSLMSSWHLDSGLDEISTKYWMEQGNLVSQDIYKYVDIDF